MLSLVSYLRLCVSSIFFLFSPLLPLFFFFFFNDPAPPEIYTLSLHDALPISLETCAAMESSHDIHRFHSALWSLFTHISTADRKSTRLNSSHVSISYAVFCLKKKKKNKKHIHYQFIYI